MKLNATKHQSEDDFGQSRPRPGRYLVVIHAVDESHSKYDSVVVDFHVLAGTTPGQEGKVHQEFYSTSDKAIERLIKLAVVTRLMNVGEEREVQFAMGLGRPLVIEIEEHKYEKDGKQRDGVRISFMGMWSVNHPDVQDVMSIPAAQQAMRQLQARAQQPAPAPAPQPQPQYAPPQQPHQQPAPQQQFAPAPAPPPQAAPAPAQGNWNF